MEPKKKKINMPGYSGKKVIQKLGIKENTSVCFIPKQYATLLGTIPQSVKISDSLLKEYDFIHFFSHSKEDLEKKFPHLLRSLKKDGSLWISWIKKSSSIHTDLTEHLVREAGLRNGLVDIKVAAIDTNWSGLKFVFRKKDRE